MGTVLLLVCLDRCFALFCFACLVLFRFCLDCFMFGYYAGCGLWDWFVGLRFVLLFFAFGSITCRLFLFALVGLAVCYLCCNCFVLFVVLLCYLWFTYVCLFVCFAGWLLDLICLCCLNAGL